MSVPQGLPVDLELKKAFQELQVKMVSTSQQLRVSDLQVEHLRKQITHSKIVDKELENLPPNIPTFNSIGRMFLKMPLEDIRQELKQDTNNHADKIKSIQNTKTYLERTLKGHESNLRELVLSKQKEPIR